MMEDALLLDMDEKYDINDRQVGLEELAVHGRRQCPPVTVSRARWADEQRLQKTLMVAVVVLNGLLIMFGVLGRWDLWTSAAESQVTVLPTRPEHEIRDVAAFPSISAQARSTRHWLEMTRRQTPAAGNASTTVPLQTFQVDAPLLGVGGGVVGAGTPDGFEGIDTTLATAGNGTAAACQVELAVTVFSSSFGAPFVGNYTPPACLGDSNTVVVNLTVKSSGRQFDRLAIV